MGPATIAALVSMGVAMAGDCVMPVVVYSVMNKKGKKKVQQGVVVLTLPQFKKE